MLQEPAPQTVDIGTGFAMGLGQGIGHAVTLGLSALLSGLAIATMLLLFAGLRWPALGHSFIANAIGGIVITLLAAVTLKPGLIPINNMLTQYSTFYEVLMLSAVALIILALFHQIRARASFTWARAAGIATAILTTIAYPYLRYTQWIS